MSYSRNILLGLLVLLSFVLNAQNATELNALAKQYITKDLDSARYFSNEALKQATINKNNIQIGFAYKNKGTIWYYKGNKKSALESYKKAIRFFNKAGDLNESSNLYHNLGLIYYKLGYNKESTENYYLAISTKKKIQKENELEGTYNGLAVMFQDMSQFDSSTYYLNLAYSLVEKTDTQNLSNIYNSIGRNYIYQGLHDSALVYYSKSIELKKYQSDTLSLALTIENIGQALSAKSNYDTAMSCYFMALKIYEKYDNEKAKARVYNNIGNLYLALEDTFRSEDNYKKSLNIYKNTNNKIGQAGIYNNLGLLKEDAGKNEHAKQFYLKATSIFLEKKNFRNLAKSYQNLASISIKLNNINDAKFYLNKSNDIALNHQLISIYYQNNYSLAEIYYNQENEKQAGEILSQIKTEQAQKYLTEESYLSRLQLISIIYSKQGRYKDAYEQLSTYDSLYKNYFNGRLFQEIADITTKYQTEKVEKENELYKKQAKIEGLKLDKQKEQNKANKIFILSTLVVLIAAFLALFFLYKTNRDRKRFNEELVDKNLIISEQNHEIEQQLDLLAEQKQLVELQKEEITDSINYAKRFQTAIIPNKEKIRSVFPDSFVLYKPRDIVSGDFFYIHQTEQYKYFVAADCTGHGVPGAFLSIIGHNGLSGAMNKFGLTDLSDIMKFLNQYLFDFLHQNQDMEIQDGIDLTIIRIDEQKQELTFSGAYNPLVLVRDKELTAYKTNKFAVGSAIDSIFDVQTINYTNGDCFYLFSDGYADQFGGPKGKKFMRKRFYQLLIDISNQKPSKQQELLASNLDSWMTQESQIDDILVVGINL